MLLGSSCNVGMAPNMLLLWLCVNLAILLCVFVVSVLVCAFAFAFAFA